jgi:gamma-glutamyltranspeptidase/glutathione hydrolase
MRSTRLRVLLVALGAGALALGVGASADVGSGSGPPTATGTGGAAATVERLATQAAIDTLRSGGNAVDAAVAAAAVLGVTEPFSCGIGGGGFMVVYLPQDEDDDDDDDDDRGRSRDDDDDDDDEDDDDRGPIVTTIDHRETAPAAMHPQSFMENGLPLPFPEARFSGLSVGVPGTVRGWERALRRYGTMRLGDVLEPAIHVAEHGFVVDQVFHDQTLGNQPFFDDIPATAALFLDPDGTPRDVGTVFRNPDLAATYRLIARRGARAFYDGALARALVETVRNPPVAPTADHVWRPGVMTRRDLERYRAPERPPTQVTYRGLDVFGMGPPSSGGSTVGEALNILEGYSLSTMTREAALHRYLDSSRYSFADRGAYLADPDFFDVPLRGLLSEDFAATRRALITDQAAAHPAAPGDPFPFNGGGSGAGQASVTSTIPGSTTHLTVSDRKGNVVSYTFTIESTGGAGLVVPGYGFLLNNELTDFDFGSITHPNRVEGGKRPRSSMSPTIVLDDGQPFLAVGSPGGSMIITTVLQVLLDRIDLGLTLPQAIADPRASQRNTPTTVGEPAFNSSADATALRLRGHTFSSVAEIGAVTGIEFLDGGRVLAAAEPTRRGGGSAMVEKPD